MSYEAIAIWSRIIGTAVVLWMLYYGFVKYLVPAIGHAQEAKNAEIAQAEERRDVARTDVDKAITELAEAGRDAEAIRQRVSDEANRDREKAITEAREAGERAMHNASGELDRARQSARDRLRVELIEKALKQARDDASARIDTAKNAEIVSRFVGSLEGNQRRG
jgi:F0F1-type ATP synthase membrane subunit b/b'